jgi:myo-inositol-1(or 4)-monophosphatase
MPDDAERLEVAIRAAREGGRIALQHAHDPLYVKVKGRRDIMVGAALRVQDAIRDVLLGAFPDDAVLAEEGPDDEIMPVDAERLWFVDPIDGTLNFLQGLPRYAVSIGFREGSAFKVGVVFDPTRDELFSARLGDGAYLNGQAIYINRPGEGVDVFEQMLIGTDLPGEMEDRLRALRAASEVAGRMQDLRIQGSPALGICDVAAGRTHGYFHFKLYVWDVAAAAVILQEAGGILTNITGGSWLHSDGGYIATNGAIHGEMLRLLRGSIPEQLRRT